MTKYKVFIHRDDSYVAEVIVEADSKDEADNKAWKKRREVSYEANSNEYKIHDWMTVELKDD